MRKVINEREKKGEKIYDVGKKNKRGIKRQGRRKKN